MFSRQINEMEQNTRYNEAHYLLLQIFAFSYKFGDTCKKQLGPNLPGATCVGETFQSTHGVTQLAIEFNSKKIVKHCACDF